MHSKGDHKQNEKITYGLGKILTNDATKKGLISKIYSLIKKKYHPVKTMHRKPKQTFLQRKHRWPTGTWKDTQYH